MGPPTVTAKTLFDAYEANEIAADQRFKGKKVRVIGSVDSIGKDIIGTPYVTLSTGHVIGTVQAMFSRRDADQLSVLSKGQAVSVDCEVSGKLMNVLVRNCTLVSR